MILELFQFLDLQGKMETKELIGFAVTFAGMAFGFGAAFANIITLRRDVNEIARHRREDSASTVRELKNIGEQLARIDQRLLNASL
jgi:hypothetical protein